VAAAATAAASAQGNADDLKCNGALSFDAMYGLQQRTVVVECR
jgi:hypothetical protein